MTTALEPEKARALPMFHSLTGIDTVSSFAEHGKKAAWAVWAVLPELTDVLLKVCRRIKEPYQKMFYPALRDLLFSFMTEQAPSARRCLNIQISSEYLCLCLCKI